MRKGNPLSVRSSTRSGLAPTELFVSSIARLQSSVRKSERLCCWRRLCYVLRMCGEQLQRCFSVDLDIPMHKQHSILTIIISHLLWGEKALPKGVCTAGSYDFSEVVRYSWMKSNYVSNGAIFFYYSLSGYPIGISCTR